MSDRNGEVMILSVPEQVTSPVPPGPAGESGSLTSLQEKVHLVMHSFIQPKVEVWATVEPWHKSGLSREAFYENGDNEAKRESAIEEFQAALDSKTCKFSNQSASLESNVEI